MKRKIRCAHCRRSFDQNPRAKNQRYCGRGPCQRARKALWQREKMARDPDYRDNQRDAWMAWQERHRSYWHDYRCRHPDYVGRNRLIQRIRDARRSSQDLAKMDALRPNLSIKPGSYYLIPDPDQNLAKMDGLAQKVTIIPVSYPYSRRLAKKDSIDTGDSLP